MAARERARSEAAAGGPAEGPGFEESLQRLEAIVKTLEGGELPLEETLRLFEEGQSLLRTCGELLGRAELRVQELLRRADGELELRPREGPGPDADDPSGRANGSTTGAGPEDARR